MNYKPLLPEKVRFIVVHCTATKPSMDWGAKEIDLEHRRRGFFEIGYHFVVRRDGTVEKGRDLDKPGAHAVSFNGISVGIVLVGGVTEKNVKVSENNYTQAQFVALHKKIGELRKLFPVAEVVGHRDLPSKHPILKDCPCFDAAEWYENY